ncbi:MAG: aminoglycoside phosphotransferase family protein [Bacteroidales bacterium]|nr:aminoglycoside phosphotransferase family protein [Bacteroidales bacterium]
MQNNEKMLEVLFRFVDKNDNTEIKPLGAGHINDSYKVRSGDNEYVLQRINHQIFKDVEKLQDNILRVTNHVRIKLEERKVEDIDRKVLNFLPTHEGEYYYKDTDGNYWRLMYFISDSKSYDTINPELAYRAGLAFGDFQKMLADLPNGPLFETISNFHNMEFRLEEFKEAVEKDDVGRLSKVSDLVKEIEARGEEMTKPERMHREGLLPKRTNHCDTKVNNILFDSNDQVLCVVDLDTVMPGYVLSDFGDFMRTGANTGEEDDTNLENVSIDLDIFEGYTKGYLENAASFLTDVEVGNLAFGAKLLTYMQTVRFLTDYLNGDTYYKTKHKEHNLERSLAQFRLLTDMEDNFDEMQQVVSEAAAKK